MVDVGHKAEPQMCVGVIKNQAVFLALSRSQSATDNLHKQHLGLSWSGQDDAVHVPVDPRRQASDVANDPNLPCLEFSMDVLALIASCVCVNVAR